ncbi:hypothetical protein PoB_002025500 [Plakobranchus ocellatus]|uniref:H-type lectin domain-containing protein n=1 Tax=Plakobranchus ocellatus TaxID=259542 RepID=A0AAV3ZF33_9GAST|nr:hypothetical protein PoB_002025500 [Plakobranchus ocellatus]
MKASVWSALAACLVAMSTVSAQINPLAFYLLGEGGMFGMNQGMSIWLYQSIENKITALEMRVKSGAVGGCESGVIGPFTPQAMTGDIQFQNPFPGAPAVSLSLSDVVVADPTLTLNIQIRPTQVTPTQASVQVTDATGALASIHVAYMACPSNSN